MLIYNGIDIVKHFNQLYPDGFFAINDIRGRSVSSNEIQILSVPHKDGSYFINSRRPNKVLEIDITLSGSNLRKRIDELNRILTTDEPVPISFIDEPEFTYSGMLENINEGGEIVNTHKVTISFLRSDPYKYGVVKKEPAKHTNNQLKIDVSNNGTKYSEPKFTVKVENPSTFLDIRNGEQYFRMGYPVSTDKKAIELKQLIMHDKSTSLVGWTNVDGKMTPVDGGIITGKIESSGSAFLATDIGTGALWHGPAIKRSIGKEPVQDFIIEAIVECRNLEPDAIGRVEVYLLDENSKVIAKIAMADASGSVSQNYGEIRAGSLDDNHRIIAESGDYPWAWNDFYGRLSIVRIGTYWEADIAKINDRGERHTERFRTWYDIEEKYTNKIAQIMVHIGAYSSVKPLYAAVRELKVWKINNNTDVEIPYILRQGDVVEIDSADASIRINGANAINTKDFMTDYIKIEKGRNEIIVLPNNIGQVEVSYRERYL